MSQEDSAEEVQSSEFIESQYTSIRSEMRDRIKTRSAKFGRGFAFLLAIIGYVYSSKTPDEWIFALVPLGILVFFLESVRNQRMLIRLGAFNKKLEECVLGNDADELGWEHVGGGRTESAWSGHAVFAILVVSYITTGAIGSTNIGEWPNSSMSFLTAVYIIILFIGLVIAALAYNKDVREQPSFE